MEKIGSRVGQSLTRAIFLIWKYVPIFVENISLLKVLISNYLFFSICVLSLNQGFSDIFDLKTKLQIGLKKPWSYPGACIIRLSCLLATSLYGFLIFFKPGVDKKSAYCIFLSIFDPTKLTRKFATEAGESIGHSGQIFRQKIYYHYFLQRMLFSCGAFETEKSKKNTVKEIPRRRSFSRVLSFRNKSLWTRANLETKEQQIPMVSHTKKRRSDRKQKIPWAVISLSPFVQDIRSFLKRSKVYFGILLSSKYLEHSRSSLWQKYQKSS